MKIKDANKSLIVFCGSGFDSTLASLYPNAYNLLSDRPDKDSSRKVVFKDKNQQNISADLKLYDYLQVFGNTLIVQFSDGKTSEELDRSIDSSKDVTKGIKNVYREIKEVHDKLNYSKQDRATSEVSASIVNESKLSNYEKLPATLSQYGKPQENLSNQQVKNSSSPPLSSNYMNIEDTNMGKYNNLGNLYTNQSSQQQPPLNNYTSNPQSTQFNYGYKPQEADSQINRANLSNISGAAPQSTYQAPSYNISNPYSNYQGYEKREFNDAKSVNSNYGVQVGGSQKPSSLDEIYNPNKMYQKTIRTDPRIKGNENELSLDYQRKGADGIGGYPTENIRSYDSGAYQPSNKYGQNVDQMSFNTQPSSFNYDINKMISQEPKSYASDPKIQPSLSGQQNFTSKPISSAALPNTKYSPSYVSGMNPPINNNYDTYHQHDRAGLSENRDKRPGSSKKYR